MSGTKKSQKIENYQFHHIDTNKCRRCTSFICEDACFRGIYKVINKKTEPKCIIIENKEDLCVKCHICTTQCKLRAITID